jgi:predicted ArsR family transcriptional regulator
MTARQKVLNYLTKNRSASAREVSCGLKMSIETVRHHLRVLVADGRLEAESARGREGRGRPEKMYSLPQAALGDNLSALSEALLSEAGVLGGDEASRMEVLAKRLAGGADLSGQPTAKRLNLIVEKLNQMHYHAHWEAGAEGPRVLFGHCPYAAIVGRHPELCEMDTNLLSLLASRPVLRESKPETQRSSCPFVFLVR